MAYSLTWLADTLAAAGLKVAETPGWRERGHGDVGPVKGVMLHHTAGALHDNMPSLQLLIDGRTDLAGPLCNLGVGRDGAFYVVAAGRAYHAGKGAWKDITTGNSSFIGIEAENSGTTSDPWPQVQTDALQRGVATLLAKINAPDETWCCGHKEYAPTRKVDPLFDMDQFRTGVAAIRNGTGPPAKPIPHVDEANRPTIRRGATGDFVKTVQGKVGASPDGVFGADTEAKVRAFQRLNQLVPDGIVGPSTWAVVQPA